MSSQASVLARGRDLRIDTVRGLLLVFMAIDHIASDLQIATYHIFGYVSAAEGFVFLSGLVAGLVYARRRLADGAEVVQVASWCRAATIYRHHVALFLFVWIWTVGTHFFHRASLLGDLDASVASWRVLAAGVLMLNQPPLLDILPMYCGLMVVLPALLAAFDRGQRSRVVLVSFAIWLFSNAVLPQAPWNIGIVSTSALSITAWQLLFVVGAACGHAWSTGKRAAPAPRASLIGTAVAICTVCYIVRHAFIPPPIPRAALDWLTDKHNLSPLRLLNTAALFYLVYAVAVTFPRVLQWRPLAFLGRNALPVFCAHVVFAYILASFPATFADTAEGRWLGTALMLGGIFVVAGFCTKPRHAKAPAPTVTPKLPQPVVALTLQPARAAG